MENSKNLIDILDSCTKYAGAPRLVTNAKKQSQDLDGFDNDELAEET